MQTKYSEELADEIVMLIAEGTPIDDTRIGDQVVKEGVASMVGVSARSIYRWQVEHPDFADRIRKAREESGHRHADQIQALSNIALDNPAMAQAVRVASENLKWLAMVRNRQYYSDSRRIEIEHTSDLGDKLLRAEQRIEETPQQNSTGTQNETPMPVEGVTTIQ